MKTQTRPCRFPRLVFRNYTTLHYQGVKFLGPPVRIIQTILQWPACHVAPAPAFYVACHVGRPALYVGTWFAN
jgi:hypothetical protein